jgi:hypothetical protein
MGCLNATNRIINAEIKNDILRKHTIRDQNKNDVKVIVEQGENKDVDNRNNNHISKIFENIKQNFNPDTDYKKTNFENYFKKPGDTEKNILNITPNSVEIQNSLNCKTLLPNANININVNVNNKARNKSTDISIYNDLNTKTFEDNINNRSTNPTTYESQEKNFGLKLLHEFNHVRTDPLSYAAKLEKMCQFIKKRSNRNTTGRAYIFQYPGAEKICLPSGDSGFKQTIELLKNTKPVIELKWNEEIKVDIPSVTEDFSKEVIENLIMNKRHKLMQKYPNFSVNLDIVTNPEVSALLQIVDEAFEGKRRNAILNPEVTNFAVSQGKDRKKKLFTFISVS